MDQIPIVVRKTLAVGKNLQNLIPRSIGIKYVVRLIYKTEYHHIQSHFNDSMSGRVRHLNIEMQMYCTLNSSKGGLFW